MKFVKIIFTIVIIYFAMIMIGRALQAKLIFYPGKLARDYRFNLGQNGEEVFLKTKDGEEINALFYSGDKEDVILYFHGNAGDLSGWQLVADDFTNVGYNILLIDYRGYGKSTGTITEDGFYEDAETAYQFLIKNKGFQPEHIIIYGRSIGTGVAVELASKHKTKGLILESPYISLTKLASQKMPLLLPSLFLKYRFDNMGKINSVKSPVLFVHGENDTLIPVSHTHKLYEHFSGKKKKIIIEEGTHNDLSEFPEYHEMLSNVAPVFFQ